MGEVEHGISNFPIRVYLTADELISSDRDTLLQSWSKQELYIDWIESQLTSAQSVAQTQLRECEEKLRQMQTELARRDSILVMRLNAKEQEMQDLIVQIQELKASQAANAVSLRSSLLDPAVNLLIQRLRKELDKAKSALEETQNELSAWKFTPDSNTGKRLMAKCRLLYQENEELGRMISSGRLAKLEGDLALQRKFGEEMKKSQSELDEFLQELDEDVEGMQSTIYYLQQQLRQTRDQLAAVQKENEILRNIGTSSTSTSAAANNSGLHPLKHEDNVDGLDRYVQANGTSDHSINQSYRTPVDRQYELPESHLKQHSERVSSQGCTVHNVMRRESEPDSNNYESGQNAEETSDIPLESEGTEERIGEADTTGNNDAAEERADVVVYQAIPDEGFNQRFSEPTQKQRTTNGSGEGSPDDGGGNTNEQISDQPGPGNSLNDNSNDAIYNRADSGAGCSNSGHRNSTEVGDLVSGSVKFRHRMKLYEIQKVKQLLRVSELGTKIVAVPSAVNGPPVRQK
nr:EOG090X0FYD [Cyclestheria hislopi]